MLIDFFEQIIIFFGIIQENIELKKIIIKVLNFIDLSETSDVRIFQ